MPMLLPAQAMKTSSMLSRALLVFALFGCAAQLATAACASNYKVKSGDTCWSIWTAKGMTDKQFYAANPGIKCNALQVRAR